MFNKLKYMLIGPPFPSEMMVEKRLNKVRALAAFSPDALSSVAYANQEIFLGLVVAGSAGLAFQLPIALAIGLLLAVVALSYAQTIKGYPSGGGSYIVARENLGTVPGLVAAGALLLDYILNAAVSLTAGIAAIASAFPELWPHRIGLALGLLAVITLLNLRGLKDTGTAMAVPVYLFLFAFFGMLLYGLFTAAAGLVPASPQASLPAATAPLTLWLVLHAFSTGCTALTGIEAISNGVPFFQTPEWSNARKTLVVMAVLMGLLFLGSIGLTQFLGVVTGPQETILSALARRLLGIDSLPYLIVQFSTLAILAVAANTSFVGFPRVAAILSRDSFLPRQLSNVGDRLVFNNGILLLAGLAAVLIVVFNGDSHVLVPLFAVGAFTAFTLSQAGMVVHWFHLKDRHWQIKATANGLGALVTGATVLIVGASKFLDGAWITVLVIPAVVMLFLKINTHYKAVSRQLTLKGPPPSLRPTPYPRVVIPVSSVHRGMVNAVNFARGISQDVTAVFIDMDPGSDENGLKKEWESWFPDVKLEIVPSPYRSLVGPLLVFLDQLDQQVNDGQQAVLILPEIVPARSWQEILHNQSADQIKKALLFQRRQDGFQRIIIDIPYHLE